MSGTHALKMSVLNVTQANTMVAMVATAISQQQFILLPFSNSLSWQDVVQIIKYTMSCLQ